MYILTNELQNERFIAVCGIANEIYSTICERALATKKMLRCPVTGRTIKAASMWKIKLKM